MTKIEFKKYCNEHYLIMGDDKEIGVVVKKRDSWDGKIYWAASRGKVERYGDTRKEAAAVLLESLELIEKESRQIKDGIRAFVKAAEKQ